MLRAVGGLVILMSALLPAGASPAAAVEASPSAAIGESPTAPIGASASPAIGASPVSGIGASPSAPNNDRTLRIGVLQSLDSMNPYNTARIVGYETYELTYQQMVGFGPELEPVADFAIDWDRAPDHRSWTFRFRPDMRWSDGAPATSEDACFSWQLALDAIQAESYIGRGYLDPGLAKAGVTKVECPNPTTMIATTDDNSSRILQTYLPILPKHIWGSYTYETIADDALFEPPADRSGLVGSGPYQGVEWGDAFVRFKQNPGYALHQGYENEIEIRFFDSPEAMVEALKAGEIDYARGVTPAQFDELKSAPDVVTVNGASNGWTELGFNTYGTGTGRTIVGGGPSTKALQDPAFRDALGYAIDKQKLVDSILGGYGTVGTTQVPPANKAWHVEPTTPRTFDLAIARQRLDAAGYKVGAGGVRVDKEGKPIHLRLVMPDSDPNFTQAAQAIVDWFGQVGIIVNAKAYAEDALIDLILPPEAGDAVKYKADYDLFIWTWSWGPDPSDPLQVFTCDQIGSSSDSLWCNDDYDALYEQQLVAPDDAARLPIVGQMQQLFYDQAPYHILYYDDALHAYRTDKFGGWQNQPSDGTPLFSYSVLGETLLTDATVVAAPSPIASAIPAAASPSAGPTASPKASDTTPTSGTSAIVAGVAVAVLIVVAAFGVRFALRRAGVGRMTEPTDATVATDAVDATAATEATNASDGNDATDPTDATDATGATDPTVGTNPTVGADPTDGADPTEPDPSPGRD